MKMDCYLQAWANSLARLLSQLSSVEWRVETAGHGAVGDVRVRVAAKAGLPGAQWFALGAGDAGKLLHLFLGEEVSVASELDQMQQEALEELVRQWCGLAATELKPGFGELSFEVAVNPGPDGTAEGAAWLLATDGSQSIVLGMSLDAELHNLLAERAGAKPEPEVTATSGPVATLEQLLRQGNLDLLMDVELPVMLRFGTRRSSLREILDLATGAVLELDREVQEPVDLVLNGKLIARGEVVVVDGNYGLRVTEVASAQQRVNSL